MPLKSTKGGTEGGVQSKTEFYKKKSNYKELIIFDDGMNKDIKHYMIIIYGI